MSEIRRVVLVSIDAFSLGLVGCYGNEWIQTPNLDRLAARGVTFDNAFAARPVAGSFLRTLPFGDRPDGWRRPPDQPERAEAQANTDQARDLFDRLHDADLATVLISNRPADRELPSSLAAGTIPDELFEESLRVDDEGSADQPRRRRHRAGVETALPAEYALPPEGHPERDAWRNRYRAALEGNDPDTDPAGLSITRLAHAAADWIEANPEEPGLIVVEACLASSPWRTPTEFRDSWLEEGETALVDPWPGPATDRDPASLRGMRAAWAGRQVFLDLVLGEVLEAIERSPLAAQTAILLTAEQGMPLGEGPWIGVNGPAVREESVHVPLVAVAPGARASVRSPALVATEDIGPTILELLNVPGDPRHSGRSLVSILFDRPGQPRDAVCCRTAGESAIVTRDWKLVLRDAGQSDPSDEEGATDRSMRFRRLFEKPDDRWEIQDKGSLHPEVADKLELQLRRHLAWLAADRLADLPPLPELPT